MLLKFAAYADKYLSNKETCSESSSRTAYLVGETPSKWASPFTRQLTEQIKRANHSNGCGSRDNFDRSCSRTAVIMKITTLKKVASSGKQSGAEGLT